MDKNGQKNVKTGKNRSKPTKPVNNGQQQSKKVNTVKNGRMVPKMCIIVP